MKKHIVLILALALGFASCEKKAATFNVSVNLANADENTMVYLRKMVDNKPVTVDSAMFTDEMAVLTDSVGDPQMLYMLKVKDMRGSMQFFPENQDVTVTGDLENPQEVKIMGAEAQSLFNEYNEADNAILEQIKDLYAQMEVAYNTNDTVAIEQLDAKGDSIRQASQDYQNDFIKTNAGSFVAHYILNSNKQDLPLEELKEKRAAFTTESIYSKDLDDYISKLEALEIGQPFIDFTLQTAEGESVNLAERIAANKVTMVDFWASWCGPCRHENPFVKAAYEKYHELGFDVLAVSVDQDEAAWLKAVEADALPYTQVRDVENSASDSYLIYYIPSNFLFDQEGKIIAKGLRGEELEAKLAETLQ